jgi:hypothetical protein
MNTELEKHERWKLKADAVARSLSKDTTYSVKEQLKLIMQQKSFNRFSNIPQDRRATYRQLILVVIKLKEILIRDYGAADSASLFESVKVSLIKQHQGNLTHGQVQQYLRNPSLPSDLKALYRIQRS